MDLPRSLLFFCLFSVLTALLPTVALAEEDPIVGAERESLRLYLPDEMLVESATRVAKPVSQVAENVTLVTSREIQDMNAHTLAEVLNRVTGVFVQFINGGPPGDLAVAHIQGSGMSSGLLEDHQVSVLIDGVPWVAIGSSNALLNTVPVGIIDKIEVIKGPASSTWGSALGGVINVITKKAGSSTVPTGTVSGAYGERNFYDARAEVSGGAGLFGYYLAGQVQGANWQHAGADYSAPALFGKIEARPRRDLTFGITLLSTTPKVDEKSVPAAVTDHKNPAFLGSATADARFSDRTTFHAGVFYEKLGVDDRASWDGSEIYGISPPAGELFGKYSYTGSAWGGGGLLTWKGGGNAVTAGADYFNAHEKSDFTNGPTAVDVFGFPATGDLSSREERYGVFLNDTVVWGPLTVTPGLRYDKSTRSEGFWSPSLGATLKVGSATVVRAQVARGFSRPSLDDLAGSAQTAGNPNLDLEKVWSWEAGVETAALPWVHLKLTAFRHGEHSPFVLAPWADVGVKVG